MFNDFKSDGFMLLLAAAVIVFIAAQSVSFMARAIKQAKELGIEKQTIKSTITSSAVFSVAPAVGIAVTVLVLSVALGYVLPWIRLSVIGAITYEVPAAEAAVDAAGIAGGIGREITDPKVFTAVAWVMALGSVFPLVLVPLLLKKIQKSVTGVVSKNTAWADVMSAAAFIGLIAAFLARGIAGIGEGEVLSDGTVLNPVVGDGAGVLSLTAIVSSVLYMLIFIAVNKRLKQKWLDALSMPLSMLLAILTVFAVSSLFPNAAAIEWRY